MRWSERRVVFYTFIILSIVLCGFFFSVFLSSIDGLRKNEIVKRVEKGCGYSFLQYNGNYSTTSVGIARIPNCKIEDFVSYESSEGNYAMISSFGKKEFRCWGSCFCEQSERKSVNGVRNLIYLLTATTTFVAIGVARSFLQEECVKKIGEIDQFCSEGKVVAEVEDCEEFSNPYDDYHEEFDEELEDDLMTTRPKKKRYRKWMGKTYYCSGTCEHTPMAKRLKKTDEFSCRDLKREGVVKMGTIDENWMRYNPKGVFQGKYLQTWCWENSKYEVNYEFNHPEKGVQGRTLVSAYCWGGYYVNPSIFCRLMEE